ncbi:MAG: 6-carboxytetrahydropterin synthase [Bacteroidales bacterium]|jgi:6-pyruvoyltetrahydropterin/6-carboxytetrahydropterin synthase|nr:6-carboxytetrahydropterin synthase [Bacteroidales bacterium]
MKIRLTKQFSFEASHALQNYEGLCRNIHGHSYKLYVTILGEAINDENDNKNGMVMDFGELKQVVNDNIVLPLDHSLILYRNSEFLPSLKDENTKLVITPFQPTCENLIKDFVEKLKNKLPSKIELVALKLYETASSYAEWKKEDNL